MRHLPVVLLLLLLAITPARADDTRQTLYEWNGGDIHLWNAPDEGGQTGRHEGAMMLRDIRHGEQMSQVAPPMWVTSTYGQAPPGSYLEARVKVPADVQLWIDLVNQHNQSIATIPLQAGTGDWQIFRVPFEGQYGSTGSDLFIRIKKAAAEGGGDSVLIGRVGIYHGDWEQHAKTIEKQAQADRQRMKHNLALTQNGCYILSSSSADVTTLFTDNAIDGDAATTWRTWPNSPQPQWLELRWEYPIEIDRVRFARLVPSPPNAPAITLQRWEREQWVTFYTLERPELNGDAIDIRFDEPIQTGRLRVVFDAFSSDAMQMGEVEVFGPPQPRIGELAPYWQAHYIWYPEPDRIVKIDPRYFRKTFDITDLEAVTSAFLQIRTNDGYIVSINGQEVARGSTEIRPIDVRPFLREGSNCIAVRCSIRRDPGWGLMAMLAELTINTAEGTTIIGTDESWRCGTEPIAGWMEASLDIRDWPGAYICATPPDQPWGRIPYFDRRNKQTVAIKSLEVSPAKARPGEDIRLKLTLSPVEAIDQDYVFLLVAGERELNSDRSNYVVARTAARADRSLGETGVGDSVAVVATLTLPTYAPDGETPIRLSALGLDRRAELSFVMDGKSIGENDAIGTLAVDRSIPEASKIEGGPEVSMTRDNGVCRITINGRDSSPLLFALQSPSLDRFGHYSDTGIHLYHLQIYPYRIDHGIDYEQVHFKFLDQHIRHLLRIDPDAYVMAEMDLRETRNWAEAHPKDLLTTAQGKPISASFASEVYAEEISSYVGSLVRFLHTQSYGDRIIGYIPEIAEPESTLGGAGQNGFEMDRIKLNIGDYNPRAIEGFRRFLREKYGGSIEALQAAWRDDKAAFDTATPQLEALTAEGFRGGVFRDPSAGRMPFDYFEYLSTLVPSFVEQNVAKVIKENSPNGALVGFYYGYNVEMLRSTNNPGALQQGNHFDFDRIIDSPYFDFFISPLQYNHRMAGDRFIPFQPYASIRLHDKLFVAELDLRTYLAGHLSYGRHRSEHETVAVLQNDLGTSIIKGSGAWFADWSSGSGHARSAVPFFDSPAMLDTISRFKEIYDDTLDLPRTGGAEIAVIVHPRAMYYHDVRYASVIYYNLITRMLYEQMPYLGAPFDIYNIDDLANPRVREQYKLFVMLNPFHLTDAQRADIEALKSGGRTLLTFYAPGYVGDERGLNVAGVSAVTGMAVKVDHEPAKQRAITTGASHPVLNGIESGTTYVAEGYEYNLRTAALHPTAFGPRFFVTDEHVESLAANDDSQVVLAIRDFGDWKSVYAAVPYLDAALLRNIAAWSGVHLYTESAPTPEIVVEANDQFLLVHNGFDEAFPELRVNLPQQAAVIDLITGQTVSASPIDSFTMDLPVSTTRFFRLEAPQSSETPDAR